ncbi:hypothetical protein C8N43_0324 [Litoreibacter ponti]|uniref:Uncharacterized protein n=1 Tax=Litoreibacter ponti TaxID=1510457 RepID=A0A2T6BI06_9RHOB|nr:hypothetical protein [Litoreibacter ponti]PTX55684.1 hypothetical protein C8N43_0324 [Litoreibacter ponti]
MKKLALVFAFCAAPLAADVTSPSGKTVDCFCTDKSGARVELGEQRCMSVGGRVYMAKCEMALNVPFWRETGQSCVLG